MLVFRCSRTGLYYPADYAELWGRKYGIGLGPEPVSEALVNLYDRKPSDRSAVLMHPLAVCRAQMDCINVTEDEYLMHVPVLQIEDKRMALRAPLMRAKQMLKSVTLRNRMPGEIENAQVILQQYSDEVRSVYVAKKTAAALKTSMSPGGDGND